MLLYKYRSLQNFKHFVDIIFNNRLFAAPYFSLNDPMEGHYLYAAGELSKELIRSIKGEKERLGICSLSRTPNDSLMWTHYADGHKGVSIGVEADRNNYDIRPINYIGLSHVNNAEINGNIETAKRILSHKFEAWAYEQEERIFVPKSEKYAKVSIREILLGTRMSPQDKSLVKNLVKKINPGIEIKDSIVSQVI